MIRNIPPKETRRWSGPYLGNYYGDLWKTFNVDLDRNEGKIGLSQRMQRIEDTNELPDLTSNPVLAFVRTDADCTDRYWALNGLAMYKTDSASQPSPSDDWDTDGLANSPTSGMNDMTVHGNDSRNDSGRNKLFVTLDSDISVLNDSGNNAWTANWWVTKQGQRPLRVGVFHPIEYFFNRKVSLIGDGNLIHTISRPSDTQNDTVTYARLTLPINFIVHHIFTTTERAWLCCYNNKTERGAVVEWDGFSQSPNRFHNVYGMAALSGVNYGESPIVLNNKGLFLEFDGNGFVPMVRNGQMVALPVAEEPGNSITTSNRIAAEGTFNVRGRGMVVGEDGLIYINLSYPTNPSFRQNAGIWCLNPRSGRLYNKHSLGVWGDSVDYGHQDLADVGGLYYISNDASIRSLLAGGLITNIGAGGGTNSGIWLLENPTSTTPSRGYFVTQYIPSDEIKDFWDTLWVRFKRFITNGNSLVVKARGGRPLVVSGGNPLQKTITWTSTTTFTVTLAAADDALQIGDEVEVINGTNSGYLAHITTIAGAHGALQTITIDETVTTGSNTADARFDRWEKIGTITSNSVYEQKINIGIDSSFIQFKVEMRGPVREVEVADLLIKSNPSVKP